MQLYNLSMEERVERLENIEAIRYLQSKYQRCLDTRDFDGLSECFTEDVVSAYDNGKNAYQGKDAVVGFLAKVMTLNLTSTHLIHGGEIDVLDPHHATAKWYLEDHLIHKYFLIELHGAAIYNVQYQKIDNTWLISSIGYERCFEYYELKFLPVVKTSFFDRLKKADPKSFGKYGQLFQFKTLKKKL